MRDLANMVSNLEKGVLAKVDMEKQQHFHSSDQSIQEPCAGNVGSECTQKRRVKLARSANLDDRTRRTQYKIKLADIDQQ